ncbi:MAG: hypothetical protein NWE93_02410 [Candidatus Bathyarchaeota archaeon]|nr:hypothetical protein [Candidatus Bathyarchaeota archaeon]
MTCYFRHLYGVFAKAGIEVTKENKRELNRTIKSIVGEGDCPLVWRQLKQRLAQDEEGFVLELKNAWQNRSAAMT